MHCIHAIKILVLLFLPTVSIGQIMYEGTVVNRSTKSSVSFATIGLFKANTVTTADEHGKFTLIANKVENDTLIISCVGYETTKIPARAFTPGMEVQLEEKKVTLKEIVVSGNYDKSIWLNDYSNCGLDWYIGNRVTTMLAQHFRSPLPNSKLVEINLCKFTGNSRFRLRVFNMDTVTHKPSTELVDSLIEISAKSKHVNINFEKYKIIIPDRDFFVAIEWLYIPYNESRVKSNIGGQKILHSEFAPYLSIRYHKKNVTDNENFLEAWELDYREKWNPMPGNMYLVMSAKVKYNKL